MNTVYNKAFSSVNATEVSHSQLFFTYIVYSIVQYSIIYVWYEVCLITEAKQKVPEVVTELRVLAETKLQFDGT